MENIVPWANITKLKSDPSFVYFYMKKWKHNKQNRFILISDKNYSSMRKFYLWPINIIEWKVTLAYDQMNEPRRRSLCMHVRWFSFSKLWIQRTWGCNIR